MNGVNWNLWTTKPAPNNSWTWTLATRLSHMLAEAETRFGNRNPAWTFVGVEFVDDVPSVWFPGYSAGVRQHVAIRLSGFTINNYLMSYWQLAHECVHLLTPTGKSEANNLEEGLTTIFQGEYMKTNFNFSCQTGNQKYDRCASLLSPWLQQDPDFIKKLRQQQNTICHITKGNILAVNPLIPSNIAEELAMKF